MRQRELCVMNNDILRKAIVYMDRRTVSMLYPRTKDDLESVVPLLDRYSNRLNTLSVEKTVELVRKTIGLGKHCLALEYLDRIPTDRMIRVLFRLVDRAGAEHMECLLGCLRTTCSGRQTDLDERYRTVVSHVENILRNRGRYRSHP